MLTPDQNSQYDSATDGVGYSILPRTVIRVTGNDRKTFLHNFCTADVKGLDVGRCCEAFILNGKGKILAHVHLFQLPESIVMTTVEGQFDEIHDHLDKYIIREDVTLADESTQVTCAFLLGAQATKQVEKFCQPPGTNHLCETQFEIDQNSFNVIVANCELAGWGYLLMATSEQIEDHLKQSDAKAIGDEVLETVRIENRTPCFGREISVDNLPQELLRDDIAISFTKGCYLGQETVARIDSLGSVNKVISLLKLDRKIEPGQQLTLDEKTVGTVLSVCWSPKFDGWIGLGYVRRLLAKPNSQFALESEGAATVIPA